MASTPWLLASLALPWGLLVPACGATSDDTLFGGARGPSAESADVDAGVPPGTELDGTAVSIVPEGDPPSGGGAGGAPDHANSHAGAGGGAETKGRGTGGATGTGGSTSPSGAPDAGPPCTKVRFYLDADGDGFGDPKRFSDACDQPSGHVTNAADCYDGNADAHPGQTTLFDVERGDGSFDYDCDGKGTPSDTTVGHCGTFPFCSGAPGWKTASPGCGVSEVWLDSCTGLTTICAQKTETRVQQCL